LKEEFLDDRPSLFCDSAVAIPARLDGAKDEIPPYTQERRSARAGRGTSRSSIGVARLRLLEPLHHERVNNGVSVGLASCFIEPLESTGIFLVEFELAMLLSYFPDRDFDPARTNAFNHVIEQLDPRHGEEALAAVRTRTRQLAENLPSHYDYLCKIHGGPPKPFVVP
jgi:hypothetical protein